MSDLPPGEPAPAASAAPVPPPMAPQPLPRVSRRTPVLIVVAVLLVLVVAAGWWFMQEYRSISGPQNAANAFLRANANSSPMDAYEMAAPTFREETPQSTWENTSRRLRLARFYAADWTDHETSGDIATLRGVIRRLDLPDLKTSVDLRRIEGSWRVATVAIEDDGAGLNQVAQTQALLQSAPVQPSQPVMAGDTTPAQASDPTVSPVMSVPRYGGVPDQASAPSSPTGLPLGRPGPYGTTVVSGQVGPACMSELWPRGFHADRVDCPTYLKTQPGLSEQCFAHAQDGRTANVTVTYLDYDPVTRQSKIDCRVTQ